MTACVCAVHVPVCAYVWTYNVYQMVMIVFGLPDCNLILIPVELRVKG